MTIKKTVLLSCALLIAAGPAFAESVVSISAPAVNNKGCRFVETANFGINFGNVTLDALAAKTYVSEKIAEIQAMAQTVGLETLEINSINYNLYSNANNYTYAGSMPPQPQLQLSGNITFIVTDPQKGVYLMQEAAQKGFNVNFSLNAYRQCS